MTTALIVAALFYVMGLLTGLDLGHRPPADAGRCPLDREGEPPYYWIVREAYRERVN